MIANRRPDILLLDIRMPQVDGFAILQALRADAAFAQLPVIVLTADTLRRPSCVRSISGPPTSSANRSIPANWDCGCAIPWRRKPIATRLENFDPITSLPNRRLFMEELGHKVQADGAYGAVLRIAINDIDKINDALGRAVTDGLLREIGARFERCLIAKWQQLPSAPGHP
jgi:PleD family two-component response regulator